MKAVLRSVCFALAGLPFVACGTPRPDPPEPTWSVPADKSAEAVPTIEAATPSVLPVYVLTGSDLSDSDGTELIVGNAARRRAEGVTGTSARDLEPAIRPVQCGASRCAGGVIEIVGDD